MRIQEAIIESSEVRLLKQPELDSVTGGYIFSTIDVSGMPDRSVECGTMWLLKKIFWPSR